ncbi:hypothetical protein [Flavobacterium sp.]|uniref:hypothetical protein n=1 Tax=Flavobacterium sp. TaxID=239 RepID=UPI002FDCE125
MKKITTLVLISLCFLSCKWTDQQVPEDEVSIKTTVSDSTQVNDKDENGCLASAGYVWSKLNKECIKIFTGIPLNPVTQPDNEDETLSAFVLFSEDLHKAEVFLPNETSSIVLTRAAEGKPWVFEDWQLVPWKGYVLKKGAESKFAGDGQMGKRVMGSDTEQ